MISVQNRYENKAGNEVIRPKSLDLTPNRHRDINGPNVIIDSVLKSVRPQVYMYIYTYIYIEIYIYIYLYTH
jgi:hypothetical protein